MSAPTTALLDTLTENNAASPPTGWATSGIAGTSNLTTSSATGCSSSAGAGADVYGTLGSVSGDVEAYMDLPTLDTTAGAFAAILLCWDPTGGGNGYRIAWQRQATDDNFVIQKVVAGTPTSLKTLAPGGHINSHVWARLVSGTIFISDSPDGTTWTDRTSIADATYSSGKIGIYLSTTVYRAKNFGGGALTAAATWNKVISPNITPEFDIIEYGSRFYSGYGNAPADWTLIPDAGGIFPRVINPYYY